MCVNRKHNSVMQGIVLSDYYYHFFLNRDKIKSIMSMYQVPRLLVFQGGYHLRKTKHVIRVVFLDFLTYQCTHIHVHRLGVQKRPELEKRVCFGEGHKFWNKIAENF